MKRELLPFSRTKIQVLLFDNTQSNNPSTSWNEPKTTKTSQPKTEEEKAQDRSSILFALGGIGTMMTYIGVKYFLVRDNS